MRSFFFFFFSSPFPSLRGALARFCATAFSCRGQAPTEPHASTRHRCLPFEHLICPVFDSGNLFSSSLPPPSPGIATTGCVEDDARSKRGTLSLLLLRILAVSALCTIGMLISYFPVCHHHSVPSPPGYFCGFCGLSPSTRLGREVRAVDNPTVFVNKDRRNYGGRV